MANANEVKTAEQIVADITNPPVAPAAPGVDPKSVVAPLPDKHLVKIDGVEHELTLDELKSYASKAKAADDRFQRAAAMRQEAQELAAWTDKVKGAAKRIKEENDQAAIPDLFKELGFDVPVEQQYAPPVQQGQQASGTASLHPDQLALLARVDNFLTGAKKQGIDPLKALTDSAAYINSDRETNQKNFTHAALTSHPVLGKMLTNPAVSKPVFEAMWGDISGRLARGEDLQAAIRTVAQEKVAFLEAAEKSIPRVGLSPASLGNVPGLVAASRIQPLKRPDPNDYKGRPAKDYMNALQAFLQQEAADNAARAAI